MPHPESAPGAAPLATIRPAEGVRVVRAADAVIAESAHALESRLGADDAPMVWLPRAEAGEPFLERTEATFELPGLGRARLLDVIGVSAALRAAAWILESPAAGAEALAGHIAFDPEQVTLERL
ncbi:DUF427 domain-containing protein [Albimonas pacifica]|uniref:Uncharacterized conserved protein, DUF427 family n=1 Tax=Albimonas pacifica TaxID=1114924 RepID=A0A1I3HUH2_9RHOB|nr:DUF427 domain-containing protein [Albimonas pacifica]SFI39207.1 Uncharacterized conserved protein, DUF427 family [Albimonas pacifica]